MILLWCITIPLIICGLIIIVADLILPAYARKLGNIHGQAACARYKYEQSHRIQDDEWKQLFKDENDKSKKAEKVIRLSNRITCSETLDGVEVIECMAIIALSTLLIIAGVFRMDYRKCEFCLEQYEECVEVGNMWQAYEFAAGYNTRVERHRAFKSSPFISMFCDERVAEMKYINYKRPNNEPN